MKHELTLEPALASSLLPPPLSPAAPPRLAVRLLQTTEEQIYELFSRVGGVKRIIMGLDRNNKTPCGFCFVESVAPRSLHLHLSNSS